MDQTFGWGKCAPFLNDEVVIIFVQVKLSDTATSEYVIRTQPTEASLSTLESIAYTLRWLEASPQLFDILVQPMRLLCHYQLEHGAVVHHSKEYKSVSHNNNPVDVLRMCCFQK